MNVLHLLRSEPDATVGQITDAMPADNTMTVVELYDSKMDWKRLIDKIFENDRVICWW